MTREERDLEGLIVPGSDHLTAYNVYAEALEQYGFMGQVYGLPRHQFRDEILDWAEDRGVLVKSIEDAALGMASVYRSLGMPLPSRLPFARNHVYKAFTDLLARIMPFEFVIDERTADGNEARVSKTSVCGSWGAVAGTIRYFAGRSGEPRAAIEGTQIPFDLIRHYATRGAPELIYDPHRKHDQLLVSRRVEYFGFEFDRELEPVKAFPPQLAQEARHVLAQAMANGTARHVSVKKNRAAIEAVRETYRRSGGKTPKLGLAELTALYEDQLAGVDSVDTFRNARLTVDPDQFVSAAERAGYDALPSLVLVREKEVWIDYDVEAHDDGTPYGVARLRLPEKLARTLVPEELPTLDRPLRFTVLRGQRGAVRADNLDELQELLARPWSPDELDDDSPYADPRKRDRRPFRGKHHHRPGKRRRSR
jgi:hypothetical protein